MQDDDFTSALAEDLEDLKRRNGGSATVTITPGELRRGLDHFRSRMPRLMINATTGDVVVAESVPHKKDSL